MNWNWKRIQEMGFERKYGSNDGWQQRDEISEAMWWIVSKLRSSKLYKTVPISIWATWRNWWLKPIPFLNKFQIVCIRQIFDFLHFHWRATSQKHFACISDWIATEIARVYYQHFDSFRVDNVLPVKCFQEKMKTMRETIETENSVDVSSRLKPFPEVGRLWCDFRSHNMEIYIFRT